MRWLSRRSGVAISTVTRWLAGEMIPSYENRQKLAEVTGLHIANEEAWR